MTTTRHINQKLKRSPRLVVTASLVLFVGLLCVGTSVFLFTFVSSSSPSSSHHHQKNNIAPTSSSSQRRQHDRPGQQQQQRLAVILPFVGSSVADIPPYLSLFCTGAVAAHDVADFWIFHNGVLAEAPVRACQRDDDDDDEGNAPNIRLVNLGSTVNLMELVATRLLDRVGSGPWAIPRAHFIPFLAKHTEMLPYTLVEYKPALGHIFADYLHGYSHWAYSDLDIVWGDMGRHLTQSDWTDFDIVTWGFGDQQRLYLRGQFTMHRNDPERINQLWRDCPYLSRIDERFARAVQREEDFQLESAEGCYSVAVLQYNDVAIKYATAAWTDIDRTVDTAYSHGIRLVRDTLHPHGQRHVLLKRASRQGPPPPLSADQLSYHRLANSVLYKDESLPWQEPVGAMEPISLPREMAHQHTDDPCQFFWIQPKYRSQLCLPEALEAHETVYWVQGQLSKQQTRDLVVAHGWLTGPFFHFQEWKRHYTPHQLVAVLDPQWSSFLLTEHGGIPVQYHDSATSKIRKRQSRSSPSSPLGLALEQYWKGDLITMLEHDEDSAQYHRLRLLPRYTYCLQHGKPQRHHGIPCEDAVVWSDTDRIQIVSAAPAWNRVDVESEVTLCLTLQMTSTTPQAAAAWVQLLADNLENWQGQPAVVIVSLQGLRESQTEQVLNVLQDRLRAYSDTAFVAVVYPKEDEQKQDAFAHKIVSRKTLMNMAMDMSPTRWYVHGMEVERGLVMNRDSVVLALRAAETSVQSGRMLWITQYGLNDSTAASTVSATTVSLKDLIQARSQDAAQSPWRFDEPCTVDNKRAESYHFSSPHVLWWLTSVALAAPDRKKLTDADVLERVKSSDEMNQDALRLLQMPDALLTSEESPILLIDNAGPYPGVRAHTLVREVEALAGVRCFQLLRMALLVAGGYQLDVLGGAFAVSSQETRNINPEYASSKCDGCPVLMGHSQTRDTLLHSEIRRIVNTAIVWENPASSNL